MNAANPDTPDANRSTPRAGLNFWQWLGIIIIVAGVAIYLYRNLTAEETPPEQIDEPAPTRAEGASGTDDAE